MSLRHTVVAAGHDHVRPAGKSSRDGSGSGSSYRRQRVADTSPLHLAEQNESDAMPASTVSTTLHPAAARMARIGRRGGPVWDMAEQIVADPDTDPAMTARAIWCRGLAILITADLALSDHGVLRLARAAMLAYAESPDERACAARCADSKTDRMLRRAARGRGC